MLNVESIQNGVVIDHIPAGKGMDIYRLLELESKTQSVALLQSVKSKKNLVRKMQSRFICHIMRICIQGEVPLNQN